MSTIQATNSETNANDGTSMKPKQKLPEWLNMKLFEEELLKHKVPGFKKIINFWAYPALSPGENYATLMLRVEIDVELESGENKSLSYMLKVPVESEVFTEAVKGYNIFALETDMYLDIVPELESIFRDSGVEVKFGAQCYKLKARDDVVLLEDLRPRGFKNANRLLGLDMEHTKCVLKKLAKWHAASATRVATIGPYPDIYNIGFFSETLRPFVEKMHETTSRGFAHCVKLYNGHEAYSASLERLNDNLVDKLFEAATIHEDEFNVLNHGDCWLNNIMFQYDDGGKIKETYLVDYQVPKYGTPAQDLFYFILSSTHYDIKLKEFDFFIKYYHDHLHKYLTLLKYSKKIPTLKDIHVQLYKYGIWGLWTVTGVMSAVLLDPNENANLDNFFSDSESGVNFKKLLYSQDRYRKHAELIMPWLQNRGVFE